jgi:hypothetical protein
MRGGFSAGQTVFIAVDRPSAEPADARTLRALAEPSLQDQIVDELEAAREERALLIAERCHVTDLRAELLQLAFDATEHPQIRGGAIAALKPCLDADVARQLLPLAQGAADAEDSHHEIKGDALRLLWPDHVSAEQLFPLLTPSDDHFFGAYAHFLRALPETLKTRDLMPALQWATLLVVAGDRRENHHLRSLTDEIMFKAWPIFDTEGLTEAFVDHVAARLRDHHPLSGPRPKGAEGIPALAAGRCSPPQDVSPRAQQEAAPSDRRVPIQGSRIRPVGGSRMAAVGGAGRRGGRARR